MLNAQSNSEKLSEQVRTARKKARLSQERLAELASISRRPIYLLETGKGQIQLDSFLKILDALGLEIELRPKRPLD